MLPKMAAMAPPPNTAEEDRKRQREDVRPLVIKLSGGVERTVGYFAPRLHTDIHTVILSIRREIRKKGKPISLSAERTAAVDAALRDGSEAGSLEGLRATIASWMQEGQAASAEGINLYYNDERAVNYTKHNAIAQKGLSERTWQLQRAQPPARAGVVLDLGCGTGLSSNLFASLGAPCVIGCDLSMAMLRFARRAGAAFDLVQADISRPLPFRDAAFAAALSVSTVQHLLQPAADGTPSAERLGTLFREVARTVARAGSDPRSVAMQIHVDGAADALRVRDAALGAGVACALLVDQPYASDSRRWFLASEASREGCGSARPTRALAPTPTADGPAAPPLAARPCALYWDMSGGCAACVLELHAALGPASLLGAEHLAWSTQEHLRAAHRWVRVLRRAARTGAAAAEAPATAELARDGLQLSAVQASVARRLIESHGVVDLELAALKANAGATLEVMHSQLPQL